MKRGYRIVYEHDSKRRGVDKIVLRLKRLGVMSVILTLVFLLLAFPSFTDWCRSVLIPGDDRLTILAVDRFTQALTQTGNLAEAVDVFCTTIIDGEG